MKNCPKVRGGEDVLRQTYLEHFVSFLRLETFSISNKMNDCRNFRYFRHVVSGLMETECDSFGGQSHISGEVIGG
jgi:hypothetical protein